MAVPTILPCDGCGQLATADHIAARLQRLEWATRFRPIHVQVMLLTASAPGTNEEFLYCPETKYLGLAGRVLEAVGVERDGRPFEDVLSEFQRRGAVLGSVLECAVEPSSDLALTQELIERHLASAAARIRRSLKPKRVLILSEELQPFLAQLSEPALGCPVHYTPLKNTTPAQAITPEELAVLRGALTAATVPGT